MLKFKTSCAVLAYLSSNLLNEVGLSLFRYFEVGLRVCDIVVKTFTFAISSPDEFLLCCVYVFVLRFLSDCVFDVCFIFYSALSVKMMMMMMMIFREGCQSAVASPLKVKSNF